MVSKPQSMKTDLIGTRRLMETVILTFKMRTAKWKSSKHKERRRCLPPSTVGLPG
ncbi:hypothetical protein PO124_21225 [Bacillus licheniformis]|nr:hypothetical protein [Bacillus licheniformis]